MIWTMLAAAATVVAVPVDEAHALGARLAHTGTVAALLPMVAEKDTEELVAAHPELTESEKAQLRAVAKRTFDEGVARIDAAFADAYAKALSLEDLRTLVAAAEAPAAQRQRAAMPMVLATALGSLGKLDFKADTLAAFCRETGKACPKP